MSDPLGEALKLLGRAAVRFFSRPGGIAFAQHGLRTISQEYSLARELRRRRAEILDESKVAAAADVIRDAVDVDQVVALQRVWEDVLASPAAESDPPSGGEVELSSPLTDGQITIVIEGAEALARYSAISQMLNEITPIETNTGVDGEEQAARRLLFVIALFFVYLAAMVGTNEVRDWEQQIGAAVFLSHAVQIARMEKKDKD